jgi:hypothetical protein
MIELVRPKLTNEWVGPITANLVGSSGATPVAGVQYAIIPRGQEPVEADWVDELANPGDPTEFGFWLFPTSTAGKWEVWGRLISNPETIVRGPYEIMTIRRT